MHNKILRVAVIVLSVAGLICMLTYLFTDIIIYQIIGYFAIIPALVLVVIYGKRLRNNNKPIN